jgi:hypothetical protein
MMFGFPFLFLLISWTLKVVRGSGCAGGSIPLLAPYETYTIGTDNSACIGGDGGSPFHFHQLGSPVQTLQVWVGGGVSPQMTASKRFLSSSLMERRTQQVPYQPPASPKVNLPLNKAKRFKDSTFSAETVLVHALAISTSKRARVEHSKWERSILTIFSIRVTRF